MPTTAWGARSFAFAECDCVIPVFDLGSRGLFVISFYFHHHHHHTIIISISNLIRSKKERIIGNNGQKFILFRHTRLELVVEPWRAGLWPAFRKVRRPVHMLMFM